MQDNPQVSNVFLRDPLPKELSQYEARLARDLGAVAFILSDCEKDPYEDRWIFPNLMGDDLAKKVPKVIVRTTEYCFFNYMAREARDLYERNDSLIDYACYGGVWHGHFMFYNLV